MKNPNQRPDREPRTWSWMRWCAVYPMESGSAYRSTEAELDEEPELPRAETSISCADHKISRSQMMGFLTRIADHAMSGNYYATGTTTLNSEIRWYASGLIGKLHELESNTPEQGLTVSYNQLRDQVNIYTEYEAIPDGELGSADVASYRMAELFEETYNKARH